MSTRSAKATLTKDDKQPDQLQAAAAAAAATGASSTTGADSQGGGSSAPTKYDDEVRALHARADGLSQDVSSINSKLESIASLLTALARSNTTDGVRAASAHWYGTAARAAADTALPHLPAALPPGSQRCGGNWHCGNCCHRSLGPADGAPRLHTVVTWAQREA
jgi:hypothetical protein